MPLAFETTRQACREVGWDYRLVCAPDPVLAANVRWLAGYPPSAERPAGGHRGASGGLHRSRGADGRRAAGRRPDRDPASAVPPAVVPGPHRRPVQTAARRLPGGCQGGAVNASASAAEGLSSYTHVTDQHAVFGTKVIVATDREAPYVLDEILGNQTDVPIAEHATDTHGASLINFALFDLVGLQLSPRIRDLGKITLYRTGSRAETTAAYPVAGTLLTRRLNTALIAEHWDEMLRLAASLKYGHVTASLIVANLSRVDRQNSLAAALKEYGALRRTVYAARYLSREDYRRKISRQLNKGESMHALRRDVFYAHEGAVRRHHLAAQTEQAWCLTIATNAISAWTTEYLGLAAEELRGRNQIGRVTWQSRPARQVGAEPDVDDHLRVCLLYTSDAA